ncbi:MAG: hypothetical protein IKJ73_11450 [Lachnospiraceae bacterium]|nr:hypothetical protein [Lachnospiraceae bacterium]
MEGNKLEKNKLLKRTGSILGKIVVGVSIFIIVAFVVLICIIIIPLPISVKNAEVNYQTSQIFTREDMDEAIAVVKDEFKGMEYFEGCRMDKIVYDGDEISLRELESLKERNLDYDECILFKTYYTRSKIACFKDSWGPEEDMFIFWLGRKDGGSWKVISSGTGY